MQRICLTMKFDLWIGSRELNFSSEALKKWSLNSTLTLDLQSWFKVTETIQLGAFYELESNWVNRGVKLQTQIFIHVFFVVFFCTLTSDLENWFKVVAHRLFMDTSVMKIESDLATRKRKYMLQRNRIIVNSEASSPETSLPLWVLFLLYWLQCSRQKFWSLSFSHSLHRSPDLLKIWKLISTCVLKQALTKKKLQNLHARIETCLSWIQQEN